jgi:ankyrin repeat protein
MVGLLVAFAVRLVAAAGGASPIADAVQKQDKAVCAALLKQHVDVNAPQGDGTTALHWAAYWGDSDLTGQLIRAGARADVRNDYGVTPLSLAAAGGSASTVVQLLKGGADPNAVVRSDETPLMIAAGAGQLDTITALIEAGAHVNSKESWNGQTALMWAATAESGQAAAVKALLDHGADIKARSNTGATAIFFAARDGSIDVVRTLLDAGADVNDKRTDLATPLLVAVVNGHADLVDFLLDRGADPNVEGGTTDLARPGVHAHAVAPDFRPLSPAEADIQNRRVNNVWGTPLDALVHVANPEQADVHYLVPIDKIRIANALLAHGANVNAQKRSSEVRWQGERYRRVLDGATPFVLAAKAADLDLMRLFLGHGADPNVPTQFHHTALMAAAGIAWASNQDHASEAQVLEVVKWLVNDLHADINAVNDFGETAMHAAAYRGANSVIQFLYDKGADLNVTAKDGRTPLIVAEGVEYGNSFAAHPESVVLLRQLGAREQKCPGTCQAATFGPDVRAVRRTR